jgi:hypothetical protein
MGEGTMSIYIYPQQVTVWGLNFTYSIISQPSFEHSVRYWAMLPFYSTFSTTMWASTEWLPECSPTYVLEKPSHRRQSLHASQTHLLFLSIFPPSIAWFSLYRHIYYNNLHAILNGLPTELP